MLYVAGAKQYNVLPYPSNCQNIFLLVIQYGIVGYLNLARERLEEALKCFLLFTGRC